jgi:hypothetical protein
MYIWSSTGTPARAAWRRESISMALLIADHAEVTWDSGKSQWLVRIHVGEEVIRRHWKGPKDAGAQTLQDDAVKTAKEEGYDLAADKVTVRG